MTWRTGRKVHRTIYEQIGPEPGDGDRLIGLMDNDVLASKAVEAVNGVRYDRVLASANERVIELEKRVDDKEEELVRLNNIAASKMAENEYLYARTVELSDTNQRIQKERDTLKSLLDADIEREQTASPDSVRREMIVELDWALHGQTYARDTPPQEVWKELLVEAKQTVAFGREGRKREKELKERCEYQEALLKQHRDDDGPAARITEHGLSHAIAFILNYYGMDARVGIADTVLADHIVAICHLLAGAGKGK